MNKRPMTCLILAIAVSGCVSKGKYDQAMTDAATRLHAVQANLASEVAEKGRQLAVSNQALSKSMQDSAALSKQLDIAIARGAACSASLDEATAQDQQLRAELARLGKNVDELLSSKGVLATSLAQARSRLEELRKAQFAAEARAALFRDLALKLRRMIDAGELEIVLRSGRMVLVLPSDVLFDSGKAKLGPYGEKTLSQVATALATLEGRRFQIAGHTDNDPIRYSDFESNWELSMARSLQVVKVMTQHGLQPAVLSAAGYGEFDPIAPNDDAAHKAKNRRIEITLQPNIEELVAVPTGR